MLYTIYRLGELGQSIGLPDFLLSDVYKYDPLEKPEIGIIWGPGTDSVTEYAGSVGILSDIKGQFGIESQYNSIKGSVGNGVQEALFL